MTRILALDTSTDACSVALRDGEVTTARFEMAARSHTRRLLPMVDEVLAEAGVSLGSLDAIAFGKGPGSFTGLRICLGVVQGLAFARDLPVIGVSTLESMAWVYWHDHPDQADRPLLVALDARMQEVYWTLLRHSDADDVERLTGEAVASPETVAAVPEVTALNGAFAGVGPGWHYSALADLKPLASKQAVYPDARFMVAPALAAWQRGEQMTAEQAQPAYVRNEVYWKKRERIRS